MNIGDRIRISSIDPHIRGIFRGLTGTLIEVAGTYSKVRLDTPISDTTIWTFRSKAVLPIDDDGEKRFIHAMKYL